MTYMFEPMRAFDATDDYLRRLKYPVIASPKIDGIRVKVHDKLYTKKSILVPNKNLQEAFSIPALKQVEGELAVGSPVAPDCFNRTTSVVSSIDADITGAAFRLFDCFLPGATYAVRLEAIQAILVPAYCCWVVPSIVCDSYEDLLDRESGFLAAGYEGLMGRNPKSLYKEGQSTESDGSLFRVKRFTDDDAIVIGFTEQQKNNNPVSYTVDGRAKRSSHKQNLAGAEMLGALVVTVTSGKYAGVSLNIGTGFTRKERQDIWANKDKFMGQQLKFKWLLCGSVNVPRHGVFLGWRFD